MDSGEPRNHVLEGRSGKGHFGASPGNIRRAIDILNLIRQVAAAMRPSPPVLWQLVNHRRTEPRINIRQEKKLGDNRTCGYGDTFAAVQTDRLTGGQTRSSLLAVRTVRVCRCKCDEHMYSRAFQLGQKSFDSIRFSLPNRFFDSIRFGNLTNLPLVH